MIAEQAVTALACIMRIPHPGFLAYKAFDDRGNAVDFNELGLRPEAQGGCEDLKRIADRLIGAVRKITGLHELDYDQDGDISVRYGSVPIFIRLVGNPPFARFYAPLVRDAPETPQLHADLNELNSSIGHMHFFLRDKAIFAICEIPALPLQHEHLATALRRFAEIADGMDDLLEAKFGGSKNRNDAKSVLIN